MGAIDTIGAVLEANTVGAIESLDSTRTIARPISNLRGLGTKRTLSPLIAPPLALRYRAYRLDNGNVFDASKRFGGPRPEQVVLAQHFDKFTE